MSRPPEKRVVLLDDPSVAWESKFMEFRLTYSGPLFAVQRDPPRNQPSKHTPNKHDIRTAFHKQLKNLWADLPNLADSPIEEPRVLVIGVDPSFKYPLVKADDLAKRHSLYGFNFVPLVTQELDLICSLDILFLRPDRPGSVVWAGDIDNRIKVLLDALRIPEAAENYSSRTPSESEIPFYCLLEDDKLITKLSVDTDRLLEPLSDKKDVHDVRLVVTVRIRPYELTRWNMHLG